MAKKTDNTNLSAKLDLRRYFLGKYHSDGEIRVMDCCQGDGVIWKQLRQEYDVASYWGLDVKKRKGRLAIDSVRVLQQSGWTENVVDIDTYGSPWKHWQALGETCHQDATVFLTLGRSNLSNMSRESVVERCLNLPRQTPAVMVGKLAGEFALRYMFTSTCASDSIKEIVQANGSNRGTKYFGIRLESKEAGDGGRQPQTHSN